MSSKATKITFSVISAILVGAAAYAFSIYRSVSCPVSDLDDFNIYITPGYTQQAVIQDIVDRNPHARTKGLERWMSHMEYGRRIHSGCYTIRKGADARQITYMLVSGSQTPVRLTLHSTRTVAGLAHDIALQLMLDSASVASRLNDPIWLDSTGYTPATVFCAIIPNTYEVYWNVSPDALLARLLKERDRFWSDERKAKARSIGLSELEVTTLASIIEEETSKSDELPKVAGLYMNRLKKRIPLQADPTVIYALGGERPKRVLKKHLEVDSPYNTYIHQGLPPGPIRFVNIRSIDAVLNYARHNYLYMCAKEDFSGYHNFATTLSQHNANARRYQNALSKAGIRK